jgi:hypothetical protein
VFGSLESERVRDGAKHWHKMVLAGTSHLKDKSPVIIVDTVDSAKSDWGVQKNSAKEVLREPG